MVLVEKKARVYLAGPFSYNPEESKLKMSQIDEFLQTEYKELEFFVPHLQGKSLGTVNKVIMTNCIIVLSKCDEIWVCGPPEISKGTQAEIAFAESVGIPVVRRDYLWDKFDKGISIEDTVEDMKPIEKDGVTSKLSFSILLKELTPIFV